MMGTMTAKPLYMTYRMSNANPARVAGFSLDNYSIWIVNMDQSPFHRKLTHNLLFNILHHTVVYLVFFSSNMLNVLYVKWRHFIQFSTWKLPCLSDSLLQYEQASYEKHVKASFWLHCSVLQTSLLPYRAAADVRGPLNQLLCGSVNRVNVTHFVENYTSSTAKFGPIWSR